MKTSTSSNSLKMHTELRKKIGESGFKDTSDFEKNAGLFEGQQITVKKLREKAWKRR